MDKQGIIEASRKRREGSASSTRPARPTGAGTRPACWKCHVKDEKLIAVEPDDSVNPNDSREDCGWENTWKGNVQMRPCAMGHSWKKESMPTRAPSASHEARGREGCRPGLLRADQLGRGARHHRREDGRDQGEVRPLRHLPFAVPPSRRTVPLAPWWEAGFGAWGEHSTSGHGWRDAAPRRRPLKTGRPSERPCPVSRRPTCSTQALRHVGHGSGGRLVRPDVVLHAPCPRVWLQDHRHRSALHAVGRDPGRPDLRFAPAPTWP